MEAEAGVDSDIEAGILRAEVQKTPKFGSFKTPESRKSTAGDARTGNSYPGEKEKDGFVRHSLVPRKSQNVAGNEKGHSLNATDDFTIDCKGDPKIPEFGTLHRYAIPQYYSLRIGEVVGLPRSNTSPKYNERRTLRMTPNAKEEEIYSIATDAPAEGIAPEADFVPLTENQSNDRKRSGFASDSEAEFLGDDLSSETDRHQQAARTCTGVWVADRARDSNTQSRLDYSQKAKTNPKDVEAWLGLIYMQGIPNNGDAHSNPTMANKKSISAVRISLFEKALSYRQEPPAKEKLLIGMMHEKASTWNAAKLSTSWKDLLKQHPDYLGLWMAHLDFKQTEHTLFTYDASLESSLRCLEVLKGLRAKHAPTHREQARLHEFQIKIMLRQTIFGQEAGFREYAVAAWQALLEFDILRSPGEDRRWASNHRLIDDATTAFEEFWDSEVPRIGEDGARGWHVWETNKKRPMQTAASSTHAISTHSDGEMNVFAEWARSEHHQLRRSRQTARTIDDNDEGDPYQIVLYSDVQAYLFSSPTAASCHVLLDAFLLFCHLPPYRSSPTFHGIPWWSVRMPLSFKFRQESERNSHFDLVVQNHRLDQDTLFAAKDTWFSAFQHVKDEDEPLTPEWVLATMKALIELPFIDDDFVEYCFAYELAISPGTVKKTAKKILKKRPHSLRLYNALALIEARLGSDSRFATIIATTLEMSKRLERPMQHDSILLWRTNMWELLRARRYTKALQRLSSFPHLASMQNEDPKGTLKVLRAEKALVALRDDLLSHGLYNLAGAAVDCLVFLAYLRDTPSLTQARMAFVSKREPFEQLPSRRAAWEILHQSFAHLVYHHVTNTRSFRPSDIRSILADSLDAFPQNTIFLSLYAWNETRFHLDDRVRSVVRDVLSNASSDTSEQGNVAPHFFAIQTELARGVTFGSNHNAVRATFERAVNSEAAAHCAALWKLYLQFEHSTCKVQRTKAVFYRAIRACPWAKELYLFAFDNLGNTGDGMSAAELKEIYHSMVEKGLRAYLDLEDLLKEKGAC